MLSPPVCSLARSPPTHSPPRPRGAESSSSSFAFSSHSARLAVRSRPETVSSSLCRLLRGHGRFPTRGRSFLGSPRMACVRPHRWLCPLVQLHTAGERTLFLQLAPQRWPRPAAHQRKKRRTFQTGDMSPGRKEGSVGDGADFLPLSSALRSYSRPEFSLGDRIMNCALISHSVLMRTL